MIILVDMDNVLCNLQEYVIASYNKKYGTNYTLDDFNEYDVSATIGFENTSKMTDIYSDPNIYNYLTPLSHSRSVIEKLVNAGHQIYVVTDAIPSTFERKVEWIKHYYPCIDESHIISMKHKWLFRCDLMIEDKIETLITGHHYDRICLDYPWNRNVHDEVYDIYRCKNWNDIAVIVDKITN